MAIISCATTSVKMLGGSERQRRATAWRFTDEEETQELPAPSMEEDLLALDQGLQKGNSLAQKA